MKRARYLRNNATEGERRLWAALRRDRFGFRVKRQVPIGPFIVDFYVPSAKLAIELDGDMHDAEYDANRDKYLSSLGVETLRIPSWYAFGDEYSLASTLERIVAAVQSRQSAPP